jgi:hypothetical protein
MTSPQCRLSLLRAPPEFKVDVAHELQKQCSTHRGATVLVSAVVTLGTHLEAVYVILVSLWMTCGVQSQSRSGTLTPRL